MISFEEFFMQEECDKYNMLQECNAIIQQKENIIKGLDNTIENLEEVVEHKENIRKEVREYITSQKLHKIQDTTGALTYQEIKLLEILDKDITKKSDCNYEKVEKENK